MLVLCAQFRGYNFTSRYTCNELHTQTEFMVQLDGAGTSQTARVVIVGATNRYLLSYNLRVLRCCTITVKAETQ